MQAVILAGGQGTRMGILTANQPKPLITIRGKALICHVLDVLPSGIDKLVIVVGFLGEQIVAHLGNDYAGKPIRYVPQRLKGTGGALLSAREVLDDRFMVINSDDLYDKVELEALLQYEAAYGIAQIPLHLSKTETVRFNKKNIFEGREPLNRESQGWMGTGVYVLHKGVWGTTFEQLQNEEYSIPHTLKKFPFPIHVHKLHYWFPINTQAEISMAEGRLRE